MTRDNRMLAALFSCLCIGIWVSGVRGLSYPTHVFTEVCKSCESRSEIRVRDYAVLKGLDEIWNNVEANVTCCLTVRPHEQEHLSLRLRRFHIDFTFSSMRIVNLTDNKTILTERFVQETDSKKPIKDLESKDGFLFEWSVKTRSPSLFLDLMLTSFVKRSEQENNQCPDLFYITCDSGSSSEFDDRCIKEVLACDEANNCGNNVDESRCHQIPVLLMFLMLAFITVALFATGFRIAQVISDRAGDTTSDWKNPIEAALDPGSEDEDPLLDPTDRLREQGAHWNQNH